jgi:hypothetical protein
MTLKVEPSQAVGREALTVANASVDCGYAVQFFGSADQLSKSSTLAFVNNKLRDRCRDGWTGRMIE